MADDVIGNQAAAIRVGVQPNTWSGYVARGRAPRPYRREITASGHALPVWSGRALDEWNRSRPGAGARTDLHRSAEGDQG